MCDNVKILLALVCYYYYMCCFIDLEKELRDMMFLSPLAPDVCGSYYRMITFVISILTVFFSELIGWSGGEK